MIVYIASMGILGMGAIVLFVRSCQLAHSYGQMQLFNIVAYILGSLIFEIFVMGYVPSV